MSKIAITGVTGNLGGLIAQILSQNNVEAIHLARTPEKAKKLSKSTVLKASYDNTENTVKALENIDVLMMVSASEGKERLNQHKDFIDAAKKAGVKHIVYTSFYNAAPNSTFTLARDHYVTEEYIKESGIKYTFIRDNFYMDFFVDMARTYNELKGPAKDGKVSAVVRRDVAQVIATIMQNPEKYENKVFNMTSSKEYTLQEIADIIGKKENKIIPYINETIEEAYESRKAWEAEQWQYDAWVSTYTAIANKEQEGISQDIQMILNRPATTLEEFLENI